MTYVDELESDFSVFHRLDIWAVSFARVIRLAGKLPAYRGSLYLAMERDAERTAAAPAAQLSTGYAQAVDGDTPPEVVERMRQESMLARFRERGVDVTGIEAITDDAMERLVNG